MLSNEPCNAKMDTMLYSGKPWIMIEYHKQFVKRPETICFCLTLIKVIYGFIAKPHNSVLKCFWGIL